MVAGHLLRVLTVLAPKHCSCEVSKMMFSVFPAIDICPEKKFNEIVIVSALFANIYLEVGKDIKMMVCLLILVLLE